MMVVTIVPCAHVTGTKVKPLTTSNSTLRAQGTMVTRTFGSNTYPEERYIFR